MIHYYITAILVVLGSAFIAVSALGLLRFKDLASRLHATTKATSFGVLLIVAGITIYFNDPITYLKGALIIIFIYLTAPLAAYAIVKSKGKDDQN
jgi:multicomponent Na+:H+ antiporter subunit G